MATQCLRTVGDAHAEAIAHERYGEFLLDHNPAESLRQLEAALTIFQRLGSPRLARTRELIAETRERILAS